jgi:hypothetical protein
VALHIFSASLIQPILTVVPRAINSARATLPESLQVILPIPSVRQSSCSPADGRRLLGPHFFAKNTPCFDLILLTLNPGPHQRHAEASPRNLPERSGRFARSRSSHPTGCLRKSPPHVPTCRWGHCEPPGSPDCLKRPKKRIVKSLRRTPTEALATFGSSPSREKFSLGGGPGGRCVFLLD